MSVLPQNIIEIQSALQNPASVTMEDLIKYVNESNPEVPPFLALIEMNRRKSMQQQPEEGGPQGTVKDQTINAVMGRPQANPTAAPPTVNPAAAPQMGNPTMQGQAMPQQAMPGQAMAQQAMPGQKPPQVNPGAMVQAAKGGLMSIPVNMFKEKNFAGGGIVAFNKGGGAKDDFVEVSPGYFVLKSEVDAEKKASRPVQNDRFVQERPGGMFVMRSELRPQAAVTTSTTTPVVNPAPAQQTAPSAQSDGQWSQSPTGLNVLTSETDNPPAARPAYTIGGRSIPIVRSLDQIQAGLPSITPIRPPPAEMTIEQAAKRNKDIQKAAGVSEDPYAEVIRFQKGIEERQAKDREQDPVNRLLAMARAFATADPAMGFGSQAAAASEASSSLEAKQKAIREKQDEVSRDFRLSTAKEEDARRRGDATGIAAALAEQKRERAEYDKLQLELDKAENARVKTAVEIQQAEATQAKLPMDLYSAENAARLIDAQVANYKSLGEDRKAERTEANSNKPTPAEKAYEKKNQQFRMEPYIVNLMKELSSGGIDPETKQKLIKDYNRQKRAYFAAELQKFPDLKLPLLDENLDEPITQPKKEGVATLGSTLGTTLSRIPGLASLHPAASQQAATAPAAAQQRPNTVPFSQLPK